MIQRNPVRSRSWWHGCNRYDVRVDCLIYFAWSGGPFIVGSKFIGQNVRSCVQAIDACSFLSVYLCHVSLHFQQDRQDALWDLLLLCRIGGDVCPLCILLCSRNQRNGLGRHGMFDRNLPASRAYTKLSLSASMLAEERLHAVMKVKSKNGGSGKIDGLEETVELNN